MNDGLKHVSGGQVHCSGFMGIFIVLSVKRVENNEELTIKMS